MYNNTLALLLIGCWVNVARPYWVVWFCWHTLTAETHEIWESTESACLGRFYNAPSLMDVPTIKIFFATFLSLSLWVHLLGLPITILSRLAHGAHFHNNYMFSGTGRTSQWLPLSCLFSLTGKVPCLEMRPRPEHRSFGPTIFARLSCVIPRNNVRPTGWTVHCPLPLESFTTKCDLAVKPGKLLLCFTSVFWSDSGFPFAACQGHATGNADSMNVSSDTERKVYIPKS
jgi:hypothetical protein